MNYISIEKWEELISLSNPIIIDIRYAYDFSQGCIPTSINIPYYHLERNYRHYLNQLDIYYLYCDVGDKSLELVKYLRCKNYKAISIIGGYQAYLDYCLKKGVKK